VKGAAEYATADDLARVYGVAKGTILQWYHAGRIPAAVAVGKVIRFDREEVAEALRAAAGKIAKFNEQQTEKTER
jgi:excisionase family DNA binding protein